MSSDLIEKIALIAVGWLFALLGPAIVDANRRQRENVAVRTILAVELQEVALKLALANHYIIKHFGEEDRQHLEWISDVVNSYRGTTPSDSIADLLVMKLSLTDQEIASNSKRTAAQPGQGIVLQKYLVPLLDSRISSLLYFRGVVPPLLLDIKNRLGLLNDTVEQVRHNTHLTFGKLEGDNYQRLVENISGSYRFYAEEAKRVADKIRSLEKLL